MWICPSNQLGRELVSRYTTAVALRKQRQRAHHEEGELRQEIEELGAELQELESNRAELMRRVGAQSRQELSQIEEDSRRFAQLSANDEKLEIEIGALTEGQDIEALEQAARQWQAAELSLRVDEVADELDAVEEKRDGLLATIASRREGLEKFRVENESAACVATEMAGVVATIRASAQRYLALDLALAILKGEVERYRQQHQGPVVGRASALFQQLTGLRFRGLEVDMLVQGDPSLHCIAENGKGIPIDGLSEGTRDQLYLALRLATLEQYQKAHEPLPLILDDILVHFDDERAEAALQVLAECAQKFQVILFTHHAHLVELARKSLPPDRLLVHELHSSRPRLSLAELRA